MNKSNKKIALIIFFVFLWLVLIFFGYQKYSQIEKTAAVNQILIGENKTGLAEQETVETEEILEYSDPEIDDAILAYLSAQEINTIEKPEEPTGFFDEVLPEFCGEFPCYTGLKFLDIYIDFENSLGLERLVKPIYNNEKIDAYIRAIAELRGYTERVFAEEADIIDFEEIKTRSDVRDAYIRMRNTLKNQNISLHLVSGYRDADLQAAIFKRKMGTVTETEVLNGHYDEKIMETLDLSALPGYSKHHSGYAVDFGCGNDYLVYRFADTECYTWMSENNFENAKRFGFLPSYPNGVPDQGPNPEPWEFVWVGVENIK